MVLLVDTILCIDSEASLGTRKKIESNGIRRYYMKWIITVLGANY